MDYEEEGEAAGAGKEDGQGFKVYWKKETYSLLDRICLQQRGLLHYSNQTFVLLVLAFAVTLAAFLVSTFAFALAAFIITAFAFALAAFLVSAFALALAAFVITAFAITLATFAITIPALAITIPALALSLSTLTLALSTRTLALLTLILSTPALAMLAMHSLLLQLLLILLNDIGTVAGNQRHTQRTAIYHTKTNNQTSPCCTDKRALTSLPTLKPANYRNIRVVHDQVRIAASELPLIHNTHDCFRGNQTQFEREVKACQTHRLPTTH